jgi:hypothetical protein
MSRDLPKRATGYATILLLQLVHPMQRVREIGELHDGLFYRVEHMRYSSSCHRQLGRLQGCCSDWRAEVKQALHQYGTISDARTPLHHNGNGDGG